MQPCAPDVVSVDASTRFGAQVALARWYATVAQGMARQFGVLLQGAADAYEATEAASAATLGAAGTVGLSFPAAACEAQAMLEAAGSPGAPPAGAGEVPAGPRDIARLIDGGRFGPGPQVWEAVAQSLRGESRRLEGAAEQLRAAISTVRQGWDSAAADAAAQRVSALQAWFEGHAAYVGGLAATATAHIGHFRTATSEIPEFAAVLNAEREVRAANTANVRSGGKLQPAVVQAQVKLSKLYVQSANGFKNYTFAAAGAASPHPPAPPPVLAPVPSNPVPRPGAGDGPVMSHKTDPARADAPLEPLHTGGGVGEDLQTAGPAWPPADVEQGVVDASQIPVLADTAGSVVPQVVPALIGGVVGGVGGALGGLAGAGTRAMQAMSPGPMMSGVGEQSGAPQQQGGGEPMHAPAPGGGGGEATDSPGGNEPGDTEPAGGQGPLGAPMGLASAPAAAAPMAAAPAVGALGESVPAAGAPMGAMMPPMMGGPRGGGGGVDDKQLYKQRQLQVTVPPNSEPVKGRREGRRAKDGAK